MRYIYDGPEQFPNIGQPCGGSQCDGLHHVCDDCGRSIDEWRESNAYPY